MLPAQEELAGCRLLCTPSSDTTRKTKHMASMFLFPNTVYGICAVGPCLLHISQYDDNDSKLCSMGHRLPPHMVLPPETTEFAACLCRTHIATPISAQCVIACINTWPSHKQTLKWLHVAAISRSYLSLHVFLFLPPAPPLRMWPLHICKLPIVPTFCRVHHFGITSGLAVMLGHFLMFPSLIIGHVSVIFHRFSSVFSLCSVARSIISGLLFSRFRETASLIFGRGGGGRGREGARASTR